MDFPTKIGIRQRGLDQEHQVLTEQVVHLQRHEMQQHVKEQVISEFMTFCDTIQDALKNPTPKVKQKVLLRNAVKPPNLFVGGIS